MQISDRKHHKINELVGCLPAASKGQVRAVEVRDIAALNLAPEFIYAKIVELPAAMWPQLEIHDGAQQFTEVIKGQLVWAQGTSEIQQTRLEAGDSIHTPSGVWHGHATLEEPVILLAAFTSVNPPKDQLMDYDWQVL